MARQRLGDKKTNKIRRQTGLPIASVHVRGGDHTKILLLENGFISYLYADGEIEHSDDKWVQITKP